MIKAIIAVDDKGGMGKENSLPWPKNTKDLNWFKKNTLDQVVIMGSKTWEDPLLPKPMKSRINVIVTNKNPSNYPGADYYLKGDIEQQIKNLEKKFLQKDLFVIGGLNILNQSMKLIKEFYITRIYGNYNCEQFINLNEIEKNMNLHKRIECDEKCHFEIWKK